MDDPVAFVGLLNGWQGRVFRPFREWVEISVLREGAPGVALCWRTRGATSGSACRCKFCSTVLPNRVGKPLR